VLEIALYSVGGLVAYSTIGYATGKTIYNNFTKKNVWEDWEDPAQILGAVFWPVSWVLMTPPLAYKVAQKAGKMLSNRPPARPKAIAYAEAPLSILAAMVAQRILAHPEAMNWESWTKDKIKVDFYSSDCRVNYVKVNDNQFNRRDFKVKDADTIQKALLKAKTIQKEKEAADALAAVNHKALDVIESLMVTPLSPEGSKSIPSQLTPL
jgi:hypothetical protein